MSQTQQDFEYVIIGGGNAAGYSCKEFIDLGISKKSTICMISSENVLPYERPALSKGFLLKKKVDLPLFNTCAFVKQRNEMKYYEENDITVKLSTTVTNIDYEKKIITTNQGDLIKYNKVLLATGCSAVKFSDFLSQDKSQLNHIYYLRDIEDARNIKRVVFDEDYKDKECVVIGGGYIGMEVTSALITQGAFKSITMIFPEEHMMKSRGIFTKTIAEKYHDLYAKNGVKFICNSDGALVDSFEANKDGNIQFVILKNGKKIPADVVIVGIGARPNVELFKDALEMDSNAKGLKVSKYLQSVSNKDVYGCGDIISFYCSSLNKTIRLEHVRHARASAIFAVKAMTETLDEEQRQKGYEFLPIFYSRIFGQNWTLYGDVHNKSVNVYCKDVDTSGDLLRNRAFRLCSIWIHKTDETVSGIMVDTDDNEERKMAERAVRNKESIQNIQAFIARFTDRMEICESSTSNINSKAMPCGKKRPLNDNTVSEEEQPPKKKQRTD